MLSSKTKRNLSRIIPFGLMWLVFSTVYTVLEKGLLGPLDYYPSTGNHYDFVSNLIVTPLLALFTGLLMGVLEILYFGRWFANQSFSRKILYKSLIYFIIIIVFLIITFMMTNQNPGGEPTREDLWKEVWAFFSDYALLSVMVFISSIIVITQFYNEVSESIGQGALRNFFTGKYHHPVEEERLFMFLDMRASTTIAEELGHVRYFEMLRMYFSDLSEPIVNCAGEIYQYAGDEVIVSWTLRDGLKENNCIRCFFAMKKALEARSEKYRERFGLLPQFKAGFHYGKVTTGEIGVLKKEIIFTGDVLNTTARIQALCNQYSVDILISGDLVKRMTLGSAFDMQSLGEQKLKGRDETIELFTVR